ncbi:ankyrin repeat domain-containing protein [Aeoliella sp. ICT_H6.2]|uniref:Ankyrin repeat domain-containing protein n=1 Tax=Aeoliella straminimaris TaxID=2954799 RepID=A0A9X2F9W4_9BACT|nr:ankyrin repeat domain-containing protein [Aeoliella straminimaris]MCO6045092.1 ankyrin repeat domain-containing protein [Aeoliella straminimaris]
MCVRNCCFLLLCIGLLVVRPATAQNPFDDSTAGNPFAQMEEAAETPGDQMAAAIDSGSIAAVRRLLDAGMSPDTMVYGGPALQWATYDDRYYVVKLLVDRGADVDLTDEYGNTTLMVASSQGSVKIVKLLLDKDANVNAVEKLYGLSALQNACEAGNDEVFDLLVEHGADIKHVDKYGGNCLEEAAFSGAKSIVEKLQAKGLKSKWPLHVAAGLGNTEQVKKLLADGADPSKANDGWKNTPLHFAAGAQHLEVAKLLKEKDANLDAKNVFGATPLHYAANEDNLEFAKWLVEQGADINAVDEEGMTVRDWSGEQVDEYLGTKGAEYGEWEEEMEE